MKNNIIRILTAVAMVINCITISFVVSAEQTYSLGDANHDGNVNVRDAAYIAHYLASRKNYLLPEEADYNQDGSINVRDAAVIANDIAKRKINKITVTTQPVVTKTETTTISPSSSDNTTETTITTEPKTTDMPTSESSTTTNTKVTTSENNTSKTTCLTTDVTTTITSTTPVTTTEAQYTTNVVVVDVVQNELRHISLSSTDYFDMDAMFDKYIERFPTKYEGVPTNVAYQEWEEYVFNWGLINYLYGNTVFQTISEWHPAAKYKQVHILKNDGLNDTPGATSTIAVRRYSYQNTVPHDIVRYGKDKGVYDYDYKNSETAQSEYAKYEWKAKYNSETKKIEYFYCDECDVHLLSGDKFWKDYYPNLMKTEEHFSEIEEPIHIITRDCNTISEDGWMYYDPLNNYKECNTMMLMPACKYPQYTIPEEIESKLEYYFTEEEPMEERWFNINKDRTRWDSDIRITHKTPNITFIGTSSMFDLIKIDNELENIDEQLAIILNQY